MPDMIIILKEGINIAKGYFNGFNEYRIEGNSAFVILKNRWKQPIDETIIDKEDLQKLIDLNYSWHIRGSKKGKNSEELNYAVNTYYYKDDNGNQKCKTIYLHNIILGVNTDLLNHINHINHNTLDNRKINLELITSMLNGQLRNKSNSNSKTGVRNVNLITKYGGKQEYWVQIMRNGEKFKWEFGLNEFDEACEFARQKRIELFGKE